MSSKSKQPRTSSRQTAPSSREASTRPSPPLSLAGADPLPHSQSLLLLAAAAIACLAPFASKAFNMDEPLFLWIAQQIQRRPLDPYGFQINWYGYAQPVSEIMINPPLASYFIALAASIVGWSEIALRLAFLAPNVALVLGVYCLARRLGARPLAAGLAFLSTPAFFVSGSLVMCDTMMVAFWVWAVILWRDGMERGSHARLAAAAALIALSALTKYYGMALVPLLLAYSLARTRRARLWMLHFLIPVLALLAYNFTTHARYGLGMLAAAANYSTDVRGDQTAGFVGNGLIGLAFAGGCVAVALWYAPLLWPRWALLAGAGLAACIIAGLALAGRVGFHALRDEAGATDWNLAVHLAVFIVAGVGVLALGVTDWLERRDADAALLCLWIVGTFVFSSYLNWTTNARTMLPLAPAVCIALMRRLDRRAAARAGTGAARVFWPLAPAFALTLMVASADYLFANTARAAAAAIATKHGGAPGTLWFEGHWGFQYYIERLGAKPLDRKAPQIARGETIAMPVNNTNVFGFPLDLARVVEKPEFPACAWLSTMNTRTKAGFYGSVMGPVPFLFGPTPAELYVILQPRIDVSGVTL